MNWLYEYISDLMNTLVVILFRENKGSTTHTLTDKYILSRALRGSCQSECRG